MRSENQSSFIEQARRAQIVEAAIDVIVDDGFARASLARIAERTGVSKGVLVYHFGTKDALVRAVVEAIYTDVGDGLEAEVTEPTDHVDRLAAYIRGNLAFVATDRRRVVALMEIFTTFRRDDGRLAYDESSMTTVIEPLESLLRAGQRAGELADFEPRIMARTIRAGIDAVTPQLAHDPDLDVAGYAEQLVQAFTRATTHGQESA